MVTARYSAEKHVVSAAHVTVRKIEQPVLQAKVSVENGINGFHSSAFSLSWRSSLAHGHRKRFSSLGHLFTLLEEVRLYILVSVFDENKTY